MSAVMAKWLWATAFFEFALAVLFLVLGILIPEVRFGFLLTGAIMIATGAGIMVWAKSVSRQVAEAARIRETGHPATASILSVRQTGMYINRQPQIELELQVDSHRHGSYKAKKKEIVPLIMMGRLTSGQPLAVKVDPADQTKFVIEWDAPAQTAVDGAEPVGWDAIRAQEARTSAGSSAAAAADKARILAMGTPATGTVLESTFAGEKDAEDQPIYILTFQIEQPGKPVMHARTTAGVPLDRIARLQPGDTVALKVDPRNPSTMAIDWEATQE